MSRGARRHLVIPDTQVGPGRPMEHLVWAGEAIAEYRPDVVVHLGDHWDMASLSTWSQPGSMEKEGARYAADIEAGNAGMDLLTAPFRKLRSYKPELHFLTGNHEQRIERAVERDPVLQDVLTYDDFDMHGFQRHDFLEPVWIDGLVYSHYFQNLNSPNAIGGSIDNRLNRIGASFVQGHAPGFMYGARPYPMGKIRHGLVAGSFYLHDEGYKGRQGNAHWRGIVVLNEVDDGTYDIMPLSMKYLQKKYG